MHLNFFPPTMLLIAAAMSTPVQLNPAANHILATRQLGLLGPLLKGIMDQNQGSPAVSPNAPIPTQVPNEDCSDAIQKIDEALKTSEQFMSTSGEQPTIKDIQAVLAILAGSLSDDCKQMNPVDDIPATPKSTALKPRMSNVCSDCERQLYGIVKGLQQILSMTHDGKGEDEVFSFVGSAMSMTTALESTAVIMPSMIATMNNMTATADSMTDPLESTTATMDSMTDEMDTMTATMDSMTTTADSVTMVMTTLSTTTLGFNLTRRA